MSKFIKMAAVVVILAIAYLTHLYYPIHVDQNRFHDSQSKIKVGMTREHVLALANDIGYLEHVAGQELIKLNGRKVSINTDTFTYFNFLLPSVLIVERNKTRQARYRQSLTPYADNHSIYLRGKLLVGCWGLLKQK